MEGQLGSGHWGPMIHPYQVGSLHPGCWWSPAPNRDASSFALKRLDVGYGIIDRVRMRGRVRTAGARDLEECSVFFELESTRVRGSVGARGSAGACARLAAEGMVFGTIVSVRTTGLLMDTMLATRESALCWVRDTHSLVLARRRTFLRRRT